MPSSTPDSSAPAPKAKPARTKAPRLDPTPIIEELAKRSSRIARGRSRTMVNCGLNREKIRFQVLFRDEYADVGLVFDESDAVTNQLMAAPYEEALEAEIAAGSVRRLPTASNVYLVEKVTLANRSPAQAAAAIMERLEWWWIRYDDKPEPPLDLS